MFKRKRLAGVRSGEFCLGFFSICDGLLGRCISQLVKNQGGQEF
jgi:hypothetical protein